MNSELCYDFCNVHFETLKSIDGENFLCMDSCSSHNNVLMQVILIQEN